MPKSPDAFRTISEVADWLGIQAHVLRFWESKFTQVKPIKRAGGRRYYRPNDMLLLGGIKTLLHDDGLTIKGVQKILREEGMNHVAAMSVPLDEVTMSQMESVSAEPEAPPAPMIEDAEPETGVVLPFDAVQTPENDVKSSQEATEKEDEEPPEDTLAAPEAKDLDTGVEAEGVTPEERVSDEPDAPAPADQTAASAPAPENTEPAIPEPADEPMSSEPMAAEPKSSEPETPAREVQNTPADKQLELGNEVQTDISAEVIVEDADGPEPEIKTSDEESATEPSADAALENGGMSPLPAFLHRPADAAPQSNQEDNSATDLVAEQDLQEKKPEDTAAPPAPRPRDIGMPDITPEAEIHAEPGALAATSYLRWLTPAQVDEMRPLVEQLSALHDSMTTQRRPAAKD